MRVLVVDDDPDQVIIRCMLLSHYGFETRRAGNADEALKAAREDHPEIVVMDLGLPTEQDGLRLIRELKKSHPSMSVIVFTGSNVQRLKVLPELRHVVDVVEKGNSCKALLNCLSRISAVRIS